MSASRNTWCEVGAGGKTYLQRKVMVLSREGTFWLGKQAWYRNVTTRQARNALLPPKSATRRKQNAGYKREEKRDFSNYIVNTQKILASKRPKGTLTPKKVSINRSGTKLAQGYKATKKRD